MRVLKFLLNAVVVGGLLLALFVGARQLDAFHPQAPEADKLADPGAKAQAARHIAPTAPMPHAAVQEPSIPALQPAPAPVTPPSVAAAAAPASDPVPIQMPAASSSAVPASAPAAGSAAVQTAAVPSTAEPASAPAARSAAFQTAALPSAAVPVSAQATGSAAFRPASVPSAPLPALLPPAAPPAITKKSAARELFAAAKEPANLAAKSIGFYAKGCLAGGRPLPVNGPAWQVMRLSRNRNWGHPSLIKYIERFAEDAKKKDGWPGLLIGDLSMPRGGPMPFGHASHQVGLDVDIWYRPEPDRELSAQERETIPMESFLSDPGHVNPEVWKPEYEQLLRRAVSYPEVARIFVNPAIKKWLCDTVKGDRRFLHKITPIMGHDDHFHVRLVCPADNPGCRNQPAIPADEGCGKGLDKWIEALSKPVAKASAPAAPRKPAAKAVVKRKPISLGELPAECETVLKAESRAPAPETAAR